MLEWEIAEVEGAALPTEEPEARERRYGWWIAFLVLGLAIGVGGVLRWQAGEQEAQLRADLTRVIEGEARVLALGSDEQVRSYADLDAPNEWRERYLNYSGRYPAGSGFPELGTVQLEADGQLARVEVVWANGEARERIEQRAYRFVNGAWRRTPYIVGDGNDEVWRTEHFTVRGPVEEVFALKGEVEASVDLEGLRQRIEADWPATWFNESAIMIRIVPEEFGPLVTYGRERNLVQINSATFARTDPTSVLTGDAQYRLTLAEQVLHRLVRAPSSLPISDTPILHRRTLFYHLIFAEARQAALSDAERTAIREGWRERMAGEWVSPFEGPLFWDFGTTEAENTWRQRRQVALHLLLDYLVQRDGSEVLGRLASEMAKFHPTVFDLEAVFVAATGQNLEALEAEARDYTLSMKD